MKIIVTHLQNGRFSSLFLLLFLLLTACQPSTTNGYHYTIHKSSGSTKAVIGDEVYLYFQIRTADTILFETPNLWGMPAKLTAENTREGSEDGPVMDILPLLAEGDSATVFMPVSEEMKAAPALQYADYVQYEVAVRKIIPAGPDQVEASAAYRKGQQALARQNRPTIDLPDLSEGLLDNSETNDKLKILTTFIRQVAKGDDSLQETPSGIRYQVISLGEGQKVAADEQIKLHYLGSLADGTIFAETYSHQQAFSFTYQAGRVIKGWDEAIGLVRRGGSLLLYIPAELAYGRAGKQPYIAPDEPLYYYIEVLN